MTTKAGKKPVAATKDRRRVTVDANEAAALVAYRVSETMAICSPGSMRDTKR